MGLAAGGAVFVWHWTGQVRTLTSDVVAVLNYLFTGSRDAVFVITEQKASDFTGLVKQEIFGVLDSARDGRGFKAPPGDNLPTVKPSRSGGRFADRWRALLWAMARVNAIKNFDRQQSIRGRPGVFEKIPGRFLGDTWYFKISPQDTAEVRGTNMEGV